MSFLSEYSERLEIRILESPPGQRALAWFRKLPDREQFFLKLGLALSIFLLVIASVVIPAFNFTAESVREYQHARDNLAWLHANETRAKQIAQSTRRHGDSGEMQQILVATAADFGLAFHRYEPSAKQGLRIWMSGVVFADVIRWLQHIHQQYQLDVLKLSISSEAVPSRVNVRVDVQG